MSFANRSLSNAAHVLEPGLVPVFSESVYLAAQQRPIKPRELFYLVQRSNERQSVLAEVYIYLNRHFSDIQYHHQSEFLADFEFIAPLTDGNQASLSSLAAPLSAEDYAYCLAQMAPISLTELNWLHNISQAATGYEPLVVDLMAVYLKLQQGKPFKNIFKAQMLEAGIELPVLHSQHYAQRQDVSEIGLDFATMQLALGQFPRVFFPELLGFTLAYCEITPLLQLLSPREQKLQNYFVTRQALLSSAIDPVQRIIRSYLDVFSREQEPLWQRIQSGYGCYRHLTWRNFVAIRKQLNQVTSPSQRFVDLIRHKMSAAFGHHQRVQFAGKSLDAWFKQEPFDANGFLNALKQSDYVDLQHPEQSRILTLFEFNKPMFGVFNEQEQTIVFDWVMSLAANAPTDFELNSAQQGGKPVITEHFAVDDTDRLVSKMTNSALFHALLNVELQPEVLFTAQRKVRQVLRWSRWLNRMPFTQYEHERFESYIQVLYQKEIKAYRPLNGTPKLSKSTYRWAIEQFAPTILVDGCWLQNVLQLQDASIQPIAELLFKIYSDELGAGILKQNHPYIYQRLLEDLAIRLPALHSVAFSEYSEFLPSAFDIPVYLLAISKFPNVFLPELLGLNMAIELSGLGSSYLRLAEALSFWGIDPTIVTVHISIDNLASGHAALAKTAIKLYMDYLATNHGTPTMHEHWRRIYDGYHSLAIVSLNFKLALLRQYFLHKRA